MSNVKQGSAETDLNAVSRTSNSDTRPKRAQLTRCDEFQELNIPDEELTPTVRSVISNLLAEIERLKGELEVGQQKFEELENIADEDPLVPILNRRAFEREMVRATAYAQRYKTPTSLIYIDLDDFKAINDTHGHAGGDAVLRHVGEVLTSNVRTSDVVARIGGDEFAIILCHADGAAAEDKIGRLLEAVTENPVKFGNVEIMIGASAGAAQFGLDDNMEALLHRADRAMYYNKRRRLREA